MTNSLKNPVRAPCRTPADEACIRQWLHGLSPRTQETYRADVERFRRHVPKPLAAVSMNDVQSFMDSLSEAPQLCRRATAAVKSLLQFAHNTGHVPSNVAKLVRPVRVRDRLTERILSQDEIQAILTAEMPPRDRLLLSTLYYLGLRAEELCSLTWRDFRETGEGHAQVSVFGKGGRTRNIAVPSELWSALKASRGDAQDHAPVFPSRKAKGFLSRSQVLRIVQHAAKAAGIDRNVSAHWLRHSHATHAIENGAPLHLVRDTLGHANLATTSLYLHARPGESSGLYLP